MIECSQVRYSYDGETLALDGVNLSVADGEFVCILGGNGSGKSTIARHLNALLVPDSGSVHVRGLDTADPELVYDIRSSVGMVFQNPDDQLVATLVEDDIAFGPENLGVPSVELAERVKAALKEVGLVGYERRETHALSGGQKQRVAIAGALAVQPRVLVLDEASSMLDPRGRAGLMRVVRELNDHGMTIVMITHFMEEAAEADRVVVFDNGHVALDGTPDEVLCRASDLQRLNLGLPPACRLSLELRARRVPVPVCVRSEDICREIIDIAWAKRVLQDRVPEIPCGVASAEPGEPACPVDPVLQLERVSYSYQSSTRERAHRRKRAKRVEEKPKWGSDADDVWALRDVNLAIGAGELLGIAGHTGSGKSTLVQHLNGLVNPTVGRVLLHGEDLADKKVSARAKGRVGVVSQYPERQLFATTVRDDIAFGPRNLGASEEEVNRRVRSSMERVGLDDPRLLDMSPFELSGGQQRRVALAGVLAMESEVLVLDEPTAGLDPVSHREFLSLVCKLHNQGLTVVMVSHNMDDLAEVCDRVVIMNEGAIFLQGTPTEVFAHADELKGVGLGVPAAQAMARDLVRAGVPLPLDRLYSSESLAATLAEIMGGDAQ